MLSPLAASQSLTSFSSWEKSPGLRAEKSLSCVGIAFSCGVERLTVYEGTRDSQNGSLIVLLGRLWKASGSMDHQRGSDGGSRCTYSVRRGSHAIRGPSRSPQCRGRHGT